MENEDWERRRREWDAWRAEENDIWERQKRKVAYRRDRDDVNRGYWEITEPLTTYEEYELRSLNDFDRWEEVTTDGNREWRLKYPNDQQTYDELSKKDHIIQRQHQFCRNQSTS